MLGAITGDIVGSVYEFNNLRRKDFEPLFHQDSKFTDDTVCTVAIADALLHDKDPAATLRDWCERYWSNGGWGKQFARWLAKGKNEPYNSFGNGSAMRVSAAAWLAKDYEHAMVLAHKVTVITHNHPEGVKGAPATARRLKRPVQMNSTHNLRILVYGLPIKIRVTHRCIPRGSLSGHFTKTEQ